MSTDTSPDHEAVAGATERARQRELLEKLMDSCEYPFERTMLHGIIEQIETRLESLPAEREAEVRAAWNEAYESGWCITYFTPDEFEAAWLRSAAYARLHAGIPAAETRPDAAEP